MTPEHAITEIKNHLDDQEVNTYLVMGKEPDGEEGLVMVKVASGEWRIADDTYDASYVAESVARLLGSGRFSWGFS